MVDSPNQRSRSVDNSSGSFGLAKVLLLSSFLALSTRLPVLVFHDYIGSGDQAGYLSAGLDLAQHRGFHRSDMHPGFPMVIALAYSLGVPINRCGQSVDFIAGLVAVGLVVLLAHGLAGRQAALWAGVICALSPELVRRSTDGMSEGLFMALFAASLAVLWRRPVTKPSSQAWWSLVGASAIMGAAHWVRPEGVLYLGGFVIASAAILATNSQRALLQIGLCTMVFGLVVLPLLWPGQGPSTDPVPLSKFSLQLDRASVESEDEFLASLEKVEVHTGAAWHLKRWGSNIFKVYHRVLPQDMDLLLAGFALMGLVLVGEGREVFSRAALVGIAVVVVPLAFILPASEGCWPRYFVSLLPVVIVFAGIGIARCREVLAPSSWKLVLALVAVLLVMYLEPLADMYKAPFVGEVPFEEKEAGAWLRDHAAPGALVMTRKTNVGWYSGLPTVRTPIGSFEQVLHWARENGVSYWVETERHTPDLRPELAFLLDRQQAPGDLELVKTIEKPMRLLIYKMRARGPAAPVRAQTER